MEKKEKRSTLKKKCDMLWGKLIRVRGRCEWCGRMNMRLEAAHIISRTYTKTRHDLFNGLCLCSGCHRKGHKFPTLFTEMVIEKLGQEKLNELHLKAMRSDYKVDYNETYGDLCLEAIGRDL